MALSLQQAFDIIEKPQPTNDPAAMERQDIARLISVVLQGGRLSNREMQDLTRAYQEGSSMVSRPIMDRAKRQSVTTSPEVPTPRPGPGSPPPRPVATEWDRIEDPMFPTAQRPPAPGGSQTQLEREREILRQLGMSSAPPTPPPPRPVATEWDRIEDPMFPTAQRPPAPGGSQTQLEREREILRQLGMSSAPPTPPPPRPVATEWDRIEDPMFPTAQRPPAPPMRPAPPGLSSAPPGKDDFYDRLSESFGGRGVLFNRALAANPYYRGVNPWARGVLENQGDPLSAMYALSGNDVGNFRDWTGKREAPFQKGNFDFMGRLQDIQGQGFLPGQGQGWNEWSSGLGDRPNPFQSLLDDDQLGSTIINEMAGRNINPALRRGYLGSLGSGIAGWRDQNPERSAFGEFARRGFRWGQ